VEPVLLDLRAGIATLTLNRPDKLNSFTGAMHRDIRDALQRMRSDSSVRVLVITGAGDAFCSGADLSNTDLTGAGLAGSQLDGVTFTGAKLGVVNLTGVDLSGAAGMEVGPDLLDLFAIDQYVRLNEIAQLRIHRHDRSAADHILASAPAAILRGLTVVVVSPRG